jgi:hypothetical protein
MLWPTSPQSDRKEAKMVSKDRAEDFFVVVGKVYCVTVLIAENEL